MHVICAMILDMSDQTKQIDTNATPKPYALLWSIAEHEHKRGLLDWDKSKFKDHLFLAPMQVEGSIRGNNLYEFLREKGVPTMNASIWEYLKENQDEIPDEWKVDNRGSAKYIFFWGTIDRSPEGDLFIRYLSWTGGNWSFGNYLIGGNWHEDFPAAVYENIKL